MLANAGYGTLHDVKHRMTLDDLLDAHEALDIKEEAQEHMMERARQP